jgi:hypothetical protein
MTHPEPGERPDPADVTTPARGVPVVPPGAAEQAAPAAPAAQAEQAPAQPSAPWAAPQGQQGPSAPHQPAQPGLQAQPGQAGFAAPPAQTYPAAQPSAGQPGAPVPGQPYPGQPHPGQPYPPQAGAPVPGQPYPAQPYPGQPGGQVPGQPYPGQPYPGQPYPGQPYPPQAGYPGQPPAPRGAPDLRRLAGPAAAAGIAYGAAFLVALVATVVLGFSTPDDGLPGEGLVRVPFFLVSMALFGPLQVGGAAGGFGLSGSVTVVPLSLTLVAFVAAAVWTALRPQRAQTPRQRWVDALLAGGVLGVGGALLAAVTRFTFDLDVDLFAIGGSFGVHPLGVLLGGVVVGTLAAATGSVVRREGVDAGRLGIRLPAYLGRVLVNLAVGGAAAALVVVVLGVVGGLVEYGVAATVLVLVTFAPNAVVYALTLGALGGISVTGGDTVSLFSGDMSAAGWLLLLPVLLAVLVAGVRGLLAAGIRPWRDLWVTPGVLLVLTLVAMLLTAVRVSTGGTMAELGGGLTGALRLSWTTLLVAVLWGLVIEVVERLLAPVVVTFVPGLPRLHARLTRRPAPATAPAGTVAATPGAPDPVGRGADPAHPADAAHPEAPTGTPAAPVVPTVSRRTAVLVGVGLAGVVVLLGGAVAAHAIVSRVVYSPEKPVLAYLEAVEAGRASQALELLGSDVPAERAGLLTDEVYADVPDRPTGGRVVEVTRRGSTAVVTVESEQAGRTVEQTFYLRKDGRELLLFDRWRLSEFDVPVARVWGVLPYDVDTFTVDGVEFPAQDGEFPALPGTYTVSLPQPEGSEGVVVSDSVTVTVQPDGRLLEELGYDETLGYTLSDEAAAAAEEQTAEFVASTCLGTTALSVEECDIDVWEWRADEATDVVWTAVGEPELVTTLDGGMVVVEVSGDARVTYNLPARDYYDAESVEDEVSYDFYVRYRTEGGRLVDPETSRYGFWD